MKTSGKTTLIIIALALLACLLVLVLRSRPDKQAEPVAASVLETSRGPAFVVHVIMPRMGLPLGGILPDWVTRKFDGTPSEVRFDNANSGAEIVSIGSDRIELKAEGWDLVVATDGEGRILPESRLALQMALGGRHVKLRCRPAVPARGKLDTRMRANSDEITGSFLVEFARCENAESGKAIEWPPAPMTVRGIFRGSPKQPSHKSCLSCLNIVMCANARIPFSHGCISSSTLIPDQPNNLEFFMIPFIQNPENGQWYLSATCGICRFKLLVFHDMNNGKGTVDGRYVVTCPQCEKSQSLPVEHYQHRAGEIKLEFAA
jgi:hypothetical protein